MENKSDKLQLILIIIITVAAIVAISALIFIAIAKQKGEQGSKFGDYYDNKVFSYIVQNTNLSQGQIIFIGDSITDFYHLDDHYADLPLAVYNRGIGGDTTFGVLNRLNVSLYNLKPSKVVLMIGINDINSGLMVNYIADNYSAILGDIKANLPDTRVLCMSVMPMNDTVLNYGAFDLDARNAEVVALNERIRALAEDKGYTYIDLFGAVADDNGKLIGEYSVDGLHLSAAGYAVWTSVVKPYLQ